MTVAGQPLFVFEDGFINDVAFGMSDEDTIAIFASALEEGRSVLQKSLQRKSQSDPEWSQLADTFTVKWDRDGVIVDYPDQVEEDVEALEYGLPDVPMKPILRPSLSSASREAARAIEKVINL